jgi:hypothetical protein
MVTTHEVFRADFCCCQFALLVCVRGTNRRTCVRGTNRRTLVYQSETIKAQRKASLQEMAADGPYHSGMRVRARPGACLQEPELLWAQVCKLPLLPGEIVSHAAMFDRCPQSFCSLSSNRASLGTSVRSLQAITQHLMLGGGHIWLLSGL